MQTGESNVDPEKDSGQHFEDDEEGQHGIEEREEG
jgi:hypothetical protein